MEEENNERYQRLRDQGLTHEEAMRRLEQEPSVSRDVASQIFRGVAESGTGLVGGLGWLGEQAGRLIPGEDFVERAGRGAQEFARSSEERLARALPAETAAGTAARFGGRMGGEVLTTLATLGAGKAGLAKYAPSVLDKVSDIVRGRRAASAVATALAESPMSFVQAAAEKSRGGDFGTALGIEALGSLAGGLLSPAIGAAARGADDAAEPAGQFAREFLSRPPAEAPPAPAVRRAIPLADDVEAADYVNIARMTDDEALQGLIQEAANRVVRETDVPLRYGAGDAPSLRGKLKEPESFAQVERDARRILANDFGVNPSDIAERTAKGERIGRAELLAVRSAFNGLLEEGNRLYNNIANGNLSPQALRVARIELDRVKANQDALMNSFMKQRTETARDLSALRISAIQNPDPILAVARVQELAKRPLSQVEREAIRKAIRERDLDALRRIANEARKPTLAEKFSTAFKAGLLTQPETQIANFLGNTAMTGLESVKDIPAQIFDRMLANALARRTNKPAVDYLTKDASLDSWWKSSRDGAMMGLREAKEALRGNPSKMQDLTRWDLGREVNYDSALMNLYTKGVFRTLDATDRFFRGVSFQRSLQEQARVLARSEGLSGPALGARSRELIDKPTDEMVARAIGDAEYAVFQDNSKLAQTALAVRRGTGELGQYLFPFAKTPANIADRILDYSPYGLVNVLRDTRSLLKDPANRALHKQVVDNAGRATVGSAAMVIGGLLASEGIMTGLYPADRETQDQWRSTGKQEGSLLLPTGRYYNLTRISPLGNLMAIGATMHEVMKDTDKNAGQKFLGVAGAPLTAITDLPMASGIRDAINALTEFSEGRGTSVARLAGRTAQGFLPFSSLLRGVTYGTDPYVRETRSPDTAESILRQAASQIPGASQMLPPRVDPLGELVEREEGVVKSLFDPFSSKENLAEDDPVRAEMERLNTSVPRLTQREDETNEDFTLRSQTVGRTTALALRALIESPGYKAMADVDPDSLREIASNFGVDLEGVKDEDISKRLQRAIFDIVSSTSRGAVGRGLFPGPETSRATRLLEELGKYK